MDFIVYMHQAPKRYRFPVSIISHTAWLYHRFNNSYRYIQEQMLYRGIILNYETIRSWCDKFSFHFKEVIKKREYRPKDKWHLDEMSIRINGEYFILWRSVDSDKYEQMYSFKSVVISNLLFVFNTFVRQLSCSNETLKCVMTSLHNNYSSMMHILIYCKSIK
jgi:hypothetical protein